MMTSPTRPSACRSSDRGHRDQRRGRGLAILGGDRLGAGCDYFGEGHILGDLAGKIKMTEDDVRQVQVLGQHDGR